MVRLKFIICAAVLMTCSCKGSVDKDHRSDNEASPYPIVSYCSAIDYSDVVALHDEELMTGRMVELTKLLLQSDSLSAQAGLSIFFEGIKRDSVALELSTRLADLYLNNPASPVRNEDKYIIFLTTLLKNDSIPSLVRERETERLGIASLNRPGSVASEFIFLDRHGKSQSLHSLSCDNLLLVFYDPECTHCADILNTLAEDQIVNSAINDGSLTVVAVYAEGKEDVWSVTKDELPANWIVAYDLSNIIDNTLYDLPAMPTLYLLDTDKRVLLKDPDVDMVRHLIADL